jgi:hypothetical protein
MGPMIPETHIIEVGASNLDEYPQVICFINPKHTYFHKKIEWLREQCKNGLKIKLLFVKGEKKPIGFIEYVPGEFCWRPVDAKGYLFIHCLWTYGKKNQRQGLGSLLIREVEKDAKNLSGVSVITSDNAFMADKSIFLKNGYSIISGYGKEQLLAKRFKDVPPPTLNDWQKELGKYPGLSIVYSRQCPWVARFIEEIQPMLAEKNLHPHITELTTAAQAQKAPSLYGVFNLIYNGRLLADRYISTTRFANILKKELKV